VNPDKLKRLAEVYAGFVRVELEPQAARDARPEAHLQRAIDRRVFEFRQAISQGRYDRLSPLKLEEVAEYVGVPRRAGEGLPLSLDRYLERMAA
jgi:hypothetical protein